MVLLKLEELAPLGVVLNYWVEEFGLVKPLVVKVVVPGSIDGIYLFSITKNNGNLPLPFFW